MELKKDPRLDLAQYSKLFLNIGFVISLTLCLIAFEWKTYEDLSRVEGPIKDIILDQPIDIQYVPVKPLPPPVVPQPKQPETDLTKDLSDIHINDLVKEDDLLPAIENVQDFIPPVVIAGHAMEAIPEENTNLPLDVWMLEKQPEGQEDFYKYIIKNLRYPDAARRGSVEGKVFVQFVVNTDGSLTDIEILKGIGFGCDEEAVRVIQRAPKWIPGKQRGKPVRVRMSVPIVFKLSK